MKLKQTFRHLSKEATMFDDWQGTQITGKTAGIEAVYYNESIELSKRFPFPACCFDHALLSSKSAT